jgi:hypothetical protein
MASLDERPSMERAKHVVLSVQRYSMPTVKHISSTAKNRQVTVSRTVGHRASVRGVRDQSCCVYGEERSIETAWLAQIHMCQPRCYGALHATRHASRGNFQRDGLFLHDHLKGEFTELPPIVGLPMQQTLRITGI